MCFATKILGHFSTDLGHGQDLCEQLLKKGTLKVSKITNCKLKGKGFKRVSQVSPKLYLPKSIRASKRPSDMAKPHVESPLDPYSVEGLVHRHENRQLLLQRLSLVRQQIKDLEREVPLKNNGFRGLDLERMLKKFGLRMEEKFRDQS